MIRILVPLLAVAVLLGGCRVDTRPKIVMEHTAGEQPVLRKAPRRGEFLLYALPEGVRKQSTREKRARTGHEFVLRCMLAKGEPLGFVSRDGELVAIAGRGDREVLAAERSYLWVMHADPGQVDGGRTALLVGAIAVGVVFVGAIVVNSFMESLLEGWALSG